MRFLLGSIGSNGDIHPYVGVGMALRERGHGVAFIAQPYFERLVTEVGLEFIPAGERFDLAEIARRPEMMGERLGSVRILRQHIIPAAGPMFAAAAEAIRRARPDAVFAHHLAFGLPWAAAQAGLPCAIGCLSPLMFLSSQDRGVYDSSGREVEAGLYHRFRKWLALTVTGWMYDPSLNRIRRQAGLEPLKGHFVRDVHNGRLTLGLWSTHYRAPMPDDPANSVICGFPWYDRHREREDTPEAIERFLDAGDPPIIFTLGSTAVHVAGPFYEAAVGACRTLGRRGLLLTGRSEYAPPVLPPGVAAFTYAPFSTVLPRGCATVHHGGIGTTAQAMRAGKPTVIVPFAHDQFDNAARARRLGVSQTVRRWVVSAESLAGALNRVLGDAEGRRRAIALGSALSGEDGADQAAIQLAVFAKNENWR